MNIPNQSLQSKYKLISELNSSERILVKNPEGLKMKLKSIQSMGKEQFAIFSDFDYTLTVNNCDGKNADSTFSVLSRSEYVSSQYKKQIKELFLKYSPLEKSNSITSEQKKEYMNTWWREAQNLVIQEKLDQTKLKNSIKNSTLSFRHGILEFINSCYEFSTPLYIVSAGLGSIIKASFEMLGNQLDTEIKNWIKFVCSEDKFDANGILSGFSEQLVTSQNKNEVLKSIPGVNSRTNACVIGDLIVDQEMVNDLKLTNKFTIGYFNSIGNDSSLLEHYMNSFDIVITNEGNLNCISYILRKLFDSNPSSQGISHKNKELIDELFA